ncbi:helix-turn-helix domain-containing protein [Nocardia terpenica]|uniref:ArsR family transcriptional regulator n=1 Tax=Nocardia terpenica TaxID=455432 RepID=A0A291RST0_9NOCA|nr:helix-turn-helix domain-containing protein [Nocardia terpenica]ATL70298.1 ArsR family transcriptional regulator [Nocardia terpenica]
MDHLELLLHPVRLRIVHALAGGRVCTTAELCASLPDIPKTTVYRHVGLLTEGAVLEIADEKRVRGTVERYYRLHPARPRIPAEAGATMSADDHRQAFTAAMAALLAEFDAYLNRPGADPYADAVGYRQGIVWLTPEERQDWVRDMTAALKDKLSKGPGPGRIPHLASWIMFPAEPSRSDE